MRWKFLIRNEDTPAYASLVYDWDADLYSMRIFDNCSEYLDVCPLMIMWWYQRGQFEISDKDCRLFLVSRVIPSGRQNMGLILRNLGVKFYHECYMLRACPKCVMDDAITELVDEDYKGEV